MTTAAIALVLLALLGLALERNHRRQYGPRPPLAGSGDGVPDRDAQRVLAELAHRPPDPAPHSDEGARKGHGSSRVDQPVACAP